MAAYLFLYKFFSIANITKKKKLILFAIADIILISSSVWLSFILRFDGQIPDQFFDTIWEVIFLLLLFTIPIFYFSGLYSFSWRYASINELVSLFKAPTLYFIFLAVAIYLSKDFPSFMGFPRSIFFTDYVLVLAFAGAIRFFKRAYSEIFNKNNKEHTKQKVLIVGAGDAGEQILRSMMSQNNYYFPVGFVDDNKSKHGVAFHGVKILGEVEDIPRLAIAKDISEIIIALPSAGSVAIKKAVEKGREAGIQKIKIVPPLSEIITSDVSFRDLRDVQVEDLLGRTPVSLDTKSIQDFINNKVILITGAAGSIGSELSRQVSKFNPALLLLLDQDETGIFNISENINRNFPGVRTVSLISDICDKEKTAGIFKKFRPNIVFHAAAYKHVPLMEKNFDEAVKNNVFGTKIVAEIALANGADTFIFISTDKAVNPVSIMGASKRIGEMICQALNQKNHTKFISVRFGNVLDSRGSVIPIFREQIKKGGPVEVTHKDMKRYFMLTSEAVLLVMQAGAMGKGGEVFVLDMGEPIRILDLAKEMIRFSGLEPDKDIAIVLTSPRPGEKFFEEILTAEEGTASTQNQKIFTARLSAVKETALEDELNVLEKVAKNNIKDELLKIFKEIVPTFKPFD